MEDIISNFGKFISQPILVHIYSSPHFSIEIFLALMLCVCYLLLIFDVNELFHITNAEALEKLKLRHPHLNESECCSRIQVISRRNETAIRKSHFVPSCRKLARQMSSKSNFGRVPQKKSLLFDRVNYLLSITPSEYVRKCKKRKNREAEIKRNIQLLTFSLEKAGNSEDNGLKHVFTRKTLRESINHIKENFRSPILDDPRMRFLDSDKNNLNSITCNNKMVSKTPMRKSHFVPSCIKLARKKSSKSKFGWVIPQKKSSLLDRVNYLLSITPSEYVRKYKKRKNREVEIKHNIQSQTSSLVKARNSEDNVLKQVFIRKSRKHTKENFGTSILDDSRTKFSDSDENSLKSSVCHYKMVEATVQVPSFNKEKREKKEKAKVDENGSLAKLSQDTVADMYDYSDSSDRSLQILKDKYID